MLVYRARLGAGATAVLSVTVRPGPGAPGLGRRRPGPACRITVRYALAEGRVARHQGTLQADLPPGASLVAAGCQLDGGEALISLRQVAAPRSAGRGAALADRFRLPVGLQAWGVTAIIGADVSLRLRCRPRDGVLVLRGCARLTLRTPGATFRLRSAFLRLVSADSAPGLKWRAAGGVTGLHLKVEPGGRVIGELVVAVRCEGRPSAAGASPGGAPGPGFRQVREVTGRIARLGAEPAGDGGAVVRGAIDADIYGLDDRGASRWTGRSLPFTALLALDGLDGQERLEPAARVERIWQDGTSLHVLLTAGVTALRPVTVRVDGSLCRVERIVGTAETAVTLTEPLWPEQPAAGALSSRESRTAFLPLPGPADGWAEAAVALGTPEARVAGATGRWRVSAALGGTPAGEAPYPAPLRAATGGTVAVGPQEGLTVVPALESLDAAGVRLRTALLCGRPLPLPDSLPAPPDLVTAEGLIALPGPARAVAGLTVGSAPATLQLQALVKLDTPGHTLVEGCVPLPAADCRRIVAAMAHPILHDGHWQLRVVIAYEKLGPAGR